MPDLKRKIPKPTGWSPERRAAQSARMRANQIWTRSTGPRTVTGKARASANSLKFGHHNTGQRLSQRMVRIALRTQCAYQKNLRQVMRMQRSGIPLSPAILSPLDLQGRRATMLLEWVVYHLHRTEQNPCCGV